MKSARERADHLWNTLPGIVRSAIDQHVPEVCGTPECPGCYAAAYVPRDRWGEDTGRSVLDVYHDNGDRAEDVEAGVARPLRSDGARFYDDDWEES